MARRLTTGVRPRLSQDGRVTWPVGRGRDGGIDEVPVPGVPGALFLCGKHAVGADPEVLLARVDATAIVCLNESHELADRYPAYVEWLRAHAGARAVHHPIPDLHAPEADELSMLAAAIHARL